ncbi:hypothetical protein, partial [Nocardia carnea]|uniref:hypothetical protein n=1 Tax=Nocardia carnea TaxID=37328 RepID=UPI0024577CDA
MGDPMLFRQTLRHVFEQSAILDHPGLLPARARLGPTVQETMAVPKGHCITTVQVFSVDLGRAAVSVNSAGPMV